MISICEKDIPNKEVLHFLCNEQWSNAACCGYLIFACEKQGFDKEKINMLLNSMQDVFDRKTVEQAKQKFCDY